MLPVSAPECAVPADDAAERGTVEVHAGLSSVATLVFNDERKVDTTLIVSKEAIPVPNHPTNKPPAKKKVSKWILWQLWFNTYRYVSITSARPRFLVSQPIR